MRPLAKLVAFAAILLGAFGAGAALGAALPSVGPGAPAPPPVGVHP